MTRPHEFRGSHLWALLIALLPASASAQEGFVFLGASLALPNYQRIPVGEWESLEAGAYFARTRDGNSCWYNPAGLAQTERTAVNASASVYEATTLEFKTFTSKARSLRLWPVGGYFGVAIAEPLARSDNVRYGFYIAQPIAWETGTVEGGAAIDPQTDINFVAASQLAATEPGIAAGFKLNERMRAGASLGVSVTSLDVAQDIAVRIADADSARTVRRTVAQVGSAWHVVARGGFQWDASDRFHVGLVASSPGLQVMGSTKVEYAYGDYSLARYLDEYLKDKEADFDYELPFNVAIGAAAQFDRGEIEFAVRYYGASAEHELISSAVVGQQVEQTAGSQPVETSFTLDPIKNEWRSVTNVAVGGNYVLNDMIRLHLGFQTDRSPVSDDGSVVFRKVNLMGGTAGASFSGKQFTGTVGLGFSTGESEPVRSSAIGDQSGETRVRVTTLRAMYSLAVHF